MLALLVLVVRVFKYSVYKTDETHDEVALKEEEDEFYSSTMDIIMSKPVSRKYSVISLTEVTNSTFYYSIYLPVCALAWRRVGYEPIVIFVKRSGAMEQEFSNFTKKTMEYLKLFNVQTFLVASPPHYENHLSQLARLYVGLLPARLVKEHDFLLLSDSDIVPVRKDFLHFYNTLSIVVNGYGTGEFLHKGIMYEEFPISYLGMRKWQWRQVMNVTQNMSLTGELVVEKASVFFGKGSVRKNNEMKKGDTHWELDQKILAIGIHNYVRATGGAIKLSRYRLRSRLDRTHSDLQWINSTKAYTQIDDCHLFHQDAQIRFELTSSLLSKMFSKKICKVLLKFFSEFFALLK
jgi:hypothetical protein